MTNSGYSGLCRDAQLPRRTVAFAPISPLSARIQTSLCSGHHLGSDHNFDITHVSRVAYLQEAARIPSYILPDGPAFSRTFATASVCRPIAHCGAHTRGRASAAHKNQTSRFFGHIPAHGYYARGSKISRIPTNSPGGRVRQLLLTRPPAIGF